MSQISERLRDIISEAAESLSEADKATLIAAVNRGAVYMKIKLNTSLDMAERDEAERSYQAEAGTIADILVAAGLERRNRAIGNLIDVAIEATVKAAIAAL